MEGGVDVQIHVFLSSALDGNEWTAPRWETAPSTNWTGGWVGPLTSPYRDSNSTLKAVQPVTSRYTEGAIPALT
jgi:hypothetical protein